MISFQRSRRHLVQEREGNYEHQNSEKRINQRIQQKSGVEIGHHYLPPK